MRNVETLVQRLRCHGSALADEADALEALMQERAEPVAPMVGFNEWERTPEYAEATHWGIWKAACEWYARTVAAPPAKPAGELPPPRLQACRTEDRAMLQTEAGQELLHKASAALALPAPDDCAEEIVKLAYEYKSSVVIPRQVFADGICAILRAYALRAIRERE